MQNALSTAPDIQDLEQAASHLNVANTLMLASEHFSCEILSWLKLGGAAHYESGEEQARHASTMIDEARDKILAAMRLVDAYAAAAHVMRPTLKAQTLPKSSDRIAHRAGGNA